jgi:hypothetical protein
MLEALTFSHCSATTHPEFLAGYRYTYPTIDEMLRHNVPAELDGVLTPSP